MSNTTGVRIPIELKQRYEKLPKHWLNFADFSREAIRLHLQEQEARALHGIEEREEPGPLRSSSKKPSS